MRRHRSNAPRDNGAIHYTMPTVDSVWSYQCECGQTWRAERWRWMNGAEIQRGMMCPDSFVHIRSMWVVGKLKRLL